MANIPDKPVTGESPRIAMDEWLETLAPDQMFSSKELAKETGVTLGSASGYLYDLSVREGKIEVIGKIGRAVYYKTGGFVRDRDHRYTGERGGHSRKGETRLLRNIPRIGREPASTPSVVTVKGDAFVPATTEPQPVVSVPDRLFNLALKAESGADIVHDLACMLAELTASKQIMRQ